MNADPVQKLILEFTRLPGIGEKTAMRLAYHILKSDQQQVERFAETLLETKAKVRLCERCFTFAENSICSYCQDLKRQTGILCVIEKPADLLAIENSQSYHGLYHVLHGVLSPLDGVGPEQIKLKELIQRVQNENISEVILAINPTVEGEATGLYIAKILKPFDVKITKIAHGIPVGGVLEFIDKQTIGRAIENRMITR